MLFSSPFMPFVRTQVEKVSSITLKYLTLRALERLIASPLCDFCAGLKICLIRVHILILTYNLQVVQISRLLNELFIDLVTEDGPLRHKVDHN